MDSPIQTVPLTTSARVVAGVGGLAATTAKVSIQVRKSAVITETAVYTAAVEGSGTSWGGGHGAAGGVRIIWGTGADSSPRAFPYQYCSENRR